MIFSSLYFKLNFIVIIEMGFSRNSTAVKKNSKKTKTNLKGILVNQTNLLRKPTWNLARLVIKLIRNLLITAEIRNKRGPRNYHRICTLREEIISFFNNRVEPVRIRRNSFNKIPKTYCIWNYQEILGSIDPDSEYSLTLSLKRIIYTHAAWKNNPPYDIWKS